jgi:diaminopimelate decarboxylase
MVNATRTSADEETDMFRVVGPLCDSIDVYFDMEGEAKVQALLEAAPELAERRDLLERQLIHMPGFRELPAATRAGDLIAVLDTGAYQLELANHYCGRPRPGAVMVRADGTVTTVRRPETPEDLWRGEET